MTSFILFIIFFFKLGLIDASICIHHTIKKNFATAFNCTLEKHRITPTKLHEKHWNFMQTIGNFSSLSTRSLFTLFFFVPLESHTNRRHNRARWRKKLYVYRGSSEKVEGGKKHNTKKNYIFEQKETHPTAAFNSFSQTKLQLYLLVFFPPRLGRSGDPRHKTLNSLDLCSHRGEEKKNRKLVCEKKTETLTVVQAVATPIVGSAARNWWYSRWVEWARELLEFWLQGNSVNKAKMSPGGRGHRSKERTLHLISVLQRSDPMWERNQKMCWCVRVYTNYAGSLSFTLSIF